MCVCVFVVVCVVVVVVVVCVCVCVCVSKCTARTDIRYFLFWLMLINLILYQYDLFSVNGKLFFEIFEAAQVEGIASRYCKMHR